MRQGVPVRGPAAPLVSRGFSFLALAGGSGSLASAAAEERGWGEEVRPPAEAQTLTPD